MDKEKTKNIKQYGLILIIILLGIFSIIQSFRVKEAQDTVKEYKTAIIESDSLRKTQDGRYQKLVNDLNTKSEINKALKENNKELYELLKEERKKPISYTIIQAEPEAKIDTIPLNNEVKDGLTFTSFEDFYPQKENYFMKYSGTLTDSSVVGKWDVSKFDIGIVISEKRKGIYEADLDAPDWFNVKSLEVNSLPLENLSPDNFDWLLGGSAGYNFLDQYPVFEIETGFRIKKSIFSIQGNTNKELKAGYKHLF
ncbi:MAG: hypothetical protein PQJ49_14160 [Sphaerochaetaceae bacterium]|nr:hypothetical protein [Sphaerochaetaceae bacterium]